MTTALMVKTLVRVMPMYRARNMTLTNEKKNRKYASQKLHSAFVDGFGRNQQPHDISSERFGEAEHQYSYQQEKHDSLNHYRTYITVTSFSIASCNDNL